MRTFPDWHDPLGVPTVGDDVRVLHEITIDGGTPLGSNFDLSVQPRSVDGKLTDRGNAIAVLAQATHNAAGSFIDRQLRSEPKSEKVEAQRVELKNLLDNYRSLLEYVAHYIAERCTPRPPANRVQFPIARECDTSDSFSKDLDRWFPGLSSAAPAVKNHLISIQSFGENEWLRNLGDLSNFNKHNCLSEQEVGQFESVQLSFGVSHLRLGDLGLHALTLEASGVLHFVDAAGNQVDLKGPRHLNMENAQSSDIDPRIRVVREVRELHCIRGSTESLARMVWMLDKNVFRTVSNVCALLP